MNEDPISKTEIQLTRWLDNAPGATPPENMDPRETARLRADAEAVAALLRRHVPASVEPPYPDFFNSQVLKKIRENHPPAARTNAPAEPSWFSALWSSVLRHPVLTVAAAGCLVLAAVTMNRSQPAAAGLVHGTRVLSVYSPEPHATAHVQSPGPEAAVIITIDGLEAFPDDRLVVGLLNDEFRPLVAAHQP